MIQIEDINALPLATEFNLDDLLVKVNRGGGPVILERLDFQTLRNALADLPITQSQIVAPNLVKISETFLTTDFTDGGGASGTVDLAATIPIGALFLYAVVTVNVALNGDTSAVLIIGDGSDGDRYNAGTPSVFTAGLKDMGEPSGVRFHTEAATITLTVTSGADFGDVADAGSLTVDLYYLATV